MKYFFINIITFLEQFSVHFVCKVKSCLCLCDLPRPCASGEIHGCAEFSFVVEWFLCVSWVSRVPVITSRSRDTGTLLRVLPGTAQSNNSTQKADQVDPHHISTQLQLRNPFTLQKKQKKNNSQLIKQLIALCGCNPISRLLKWGLFYCTQFRVKKRRSQYVLDERSEPLQ